MTDEIEVLCGQCAGRKGRLVRDTGDCVTVRLAGDPSDMLRVYSKDNVRNVDKKEVAK